VTVSLSKEILSAEGIPLPAGHAWNFWVASGQGTLDQTELERISVREPGEGHIQTYGANAADLNEDGYTDLSLPNEISNDLRIFLNDGQGGYDGFTIHPIPEGNSASANEAVDLDGDMHLDMVVCSGGNDRMAVMMGDGNGGFTSATSYQAGFSVRGVAAMDLDGDGDQDIVTANRSANNLTLFLNNGDGTFQPRVIMEGGGSQETACAAADADNDGILDLFVGALGSNEMLLLLGDGTGGLTFAGKVNAGGSPWMIATGDIDNDGNVDVVSANSSSNNVSVIRGTGAGGMLPAETYPAGSFVLAIDLGDLDGDGDLDMVASNYGSGDWTVYENDGTGVFMNPRTLAASVAGSCATLHDRDNDGDLDITGIDEIDDLVFIFSNETPSSVGSEQEPGEAFALLQNFPNPFNPRTEIEFRIPEAGRATLKIFDLLGRETATLVDEWKSPGTYGATWDAAGMASGVYIYRLTAGTFVASKRLLLLR
jgi:hypothetical protein